MEYSYIDFIVGGLILILGLKGIFNGLIKEVFGLAGIAGGVYLASSYASAFGMFLSDTLFKFEQESVSTLVGFVILLALSWGGIILLGNLIAKLTKLSGLGIVDKSMGFVFGAGKVFVIFSLIAYAFSSVEIVAQNMQKFTKNSILFPVLRDAGGAIIKIDPKMFENSAIKDSAPADIDRENLNMQQLQEHIKQKMQGQTQPQKEAVQKDSDG